MTARIQYEQFAERAAWLDEIRRVEKHTSCAGTGYVVDSLRSAWQAVSQASDFVSTICAAVRFGNDTDTTAAVAGSLAGVIWSVDAIPERWRNELRLGQEQRVLIAEFAKLVSENTESAFSTAAEPCN